MGKFLLLFSGLFIFSFHIRAQSCFAGFAGPDTTVPCGQTCINLHVTVPDLRSTDDYTVKPIQYNPYPFVTTAPALSLSCANQDDKFFTPSVLPFTFCFYGLSYNSLVVGTNGLVTFDMADSLNCNHWSLTGGSPIPYTGTGTLCGTSCPSPSGVLYPRACIFGVYHDIDIDYTSANKKMEFRIEGNAPCRRAVISFNEIPYFSCTTITATHEIVIYESTGIVEIYIKDKPLCAGWNSGYAVAGIQNWNRDQGLAPPGRNLGSWGTTGMNEAWQFKPNGVSSLLDHVELYDHGSLIGTGTVGVSSNGNIDITFPNICPATVPNSYTVRAYYKKCNDDPTTYFIEDDVVISGLGGLPASATSTPANCAANNGTITVTPTGGVAPFSYTLNGGASQLSNIFSGLAAGTYTVVVTDATGCSRTLTVIVGTVSNISANAVPTATSCPGVNNGKITVTPVTGTAPFMYSINGGTTYQVSNIFTLLAPGTYTITFKDANGCVGTTTATIIAGTNLQSTFSQTNPPCAGANTGSITVTPTTGTAPYSFSLNGGPGQPGGTFNGLMVGIYTINFTDAIGCTGTQSVTLTGSTPITATPNITPPLCFGNSNGSITVTPNGGVSPYQYSINGGASYSFSPTFSGIAAGNYTIRIKDANGCTFDLPVTMGQPTSLSAFALAFQATCNGNDGIINVSGNGGTLNYVYSIDGGVSFLAGNFFTVPLGIYNNIIVKDANGCQANTSASITLLDSMRLNAGPDTTICVGSSYTMQPTTNAQTTGFSWSPVTGLSNPAIANPVATPGDTTRYILTAIWGVCTRVDTMFINVLHKPVPNAGNDTAICFQTFALLRGSASNVSGPVSYLWTPSGTVLPSNAAFATARPDSTQIYTLTVKDNYGCNFSVSDNVLVTMQPPVPAYAGNDTIAVLGVPHQMFSSGGVSYLWIPATPLDNPFTQFPKATLYNDTYFTVKVTDIAGCTGTDDVFIKVYRGPTYYLPNAFTPNGDGLNDIFRPIPVGIKSTDYFRVYNRYGQLIFETTQWLKGWDGTYKGQTQPAGTYVWMIRGTDRDGKIVEMKGAVILVH